MTALAVMEASALAEHEAAIETERDGFVERTFSHLLAIRANRLYREDFGTFEDYCHKRWGLTKTHVNRIIQHAQVVEALTPTGVTPIPERQARELAPLLDQPEVLRETWRQAVEQTDGRPTAAAVREAREVIAPRPEPVKVTAPEPAATVEEFIAQRDTGQVLSPEQWQAQNQPDQPVPDTLAAARAEAARHPSIVTGEAMKHLERARRALLAAGTPTEILADHDTDPIDTTGDWLYEIDASIAVLTPLAAALRRRHIRSVK